MIQTTGPLEGPRAPGAPVAFAGADRTAAVGVPLPLPGFVSFTNTLPTVNLWQLYSGPTGVTFANPNLTNTTVTFSAPGTYTLRLSGSNGVHAIAYDAVVITVTEGIPLSITRSGNIANLSWTGGNPPFVVERSPTLLAVTWSGVLTTSVQNAAIPITPGSAFFRVRSP